MGKLSEKYDLLIKRGVGGLVIAQLNVKKIGRAKRRELASILSNLKIDCLAVVEHHILAGDYVDDKNASLKDCPSLKIKGYNSASKHRDQSSGGVAWYWKKCLNVDIWEGAKLPEALSTAARERGWIKIQCKTSQIAFEVVYMPTETTNDSNRDKYQDILDVLFLDSKDLQKEGIKDFLVGDFNAHVGSPTEDPLGIEGNKNTLGHNGTRLLLWLQSQGKILVNSQSITKGLWTFQSAGGKTMSILDFMICNVEDLPLVKGMVIDDDREVTSINTDHNVLISLLDVNYQKVVWEKPKPRSKWDTKTTDTQSFRSTLETKLEEAALDRVKKGRDNSPAQIISGVTDSLNSALKTSTKQVSSTPPKPKMSKEVLDLTEKIKKAEGERASLVKQHRGTTTNLSEPEKVRLEELNNLITTLRTQKDETLLAQMSAEDKKTRDIINSKGKKSTAFWRVTNPQEEDTINSLKNKDGTQTTTQKETLSRVEEHFQELFTARERPPDRDPLPCPQVGKSKSLIKPFTQRQVRRALQKLKPNKATGPDGIPNEVLKMGAAILAPTLKKAFNLILLRGDPIPAWADGLMYLIYKGKGDKRDLNNYRGITVNNSLSKVFASLLNDRLANFVEKRGALGQIQNGGHNNRQGLDTLFVIRTVLEKSSGSGDSS